MFPSLLAKDVQQGLWQFLQTGFEPSDHFFHGLMQRFVSNTNSWMKGPYLQMGLPFTPGQLGKQFFSDFETQFPGHHHQEAAWKRISHQHEAVSTLVATGTGSGKTECFVYPILDYCLQARKNAQPGIKALIIYPMNALATDQAQRFASLIHNTPAFKGLRVGLYVGGISEIGQDGSTMTATECITNRESLRKNPPDILLTNYKMLDYLLLRPKDRALWSKNTADTLRYLVVDELHTFDGAQGTDLALLLRRLKSRLKTPEQHLICVGTSATLGNNKNTQALREYARQIFSTAFEENSVITENRLLFSEFLEDATVNTMFQHQEQLANLLKPENYPHIDAAICAWATAFFPEIYDPSQGTEPISLEQIPLKKWRLRLGQHLKSHQLFVNLLKVVKSQVLSYEDLIELLRPSLPIKSRPFTESIIDALLVLVAWALRPINLAAEKNFNSKADAVADAVPDAELKTQPLVYLRLQIWIKELRRMVAKIAVQSQEVELVASSSLNANPNGVYLPLVQCTQCHTSAWLTKLVNGSNKVSDSLEEIYNAFFSKRQEVARIYPQASLPFYKNSVLKSICPACGHLQNGAANSENMACAACAHEGLLAVILVNETSSYAVGNTQYVRHDTSCPACQSKDKIILFGARTATLASQVIEQSWASNYNDDKKLIAFSDSVQDAAHRAGYFSARTYLNNVRTSIAQTIDYLLNKQGQTEMPWSDFIDQSYRLFDDPQSPLYLAPIDFVAEFIPPNLMWEPDWEKEIVEKGKLPPNSKLPSYIKKRIIWQAYTDFSYLSHRGRNLDRIGKATLVLPFKNIQTIASKLLPKAVEQLGLHGLQHATLCQWLWGLLTQMKRRGGLMHQDLQSYFEEGKIYVLSQISAASPWLPNMSERSPRPVFISLGDHKEFDKPTKSPNNWYERWTQVVLQQEVLTAKGLPTDLFLMAVEELVAANVLIKAQSNWGESLALNPALLILTTQTTWLSTAQGKRKITIAKSDFEHLKDMPCLDALQEKYTESISPQQWHIQRFSKGHIRRVIAAEHTGLLERKQREELENRFKHKDHKAWYENLLSATPTLEMGVDIGDLSSVLLCSVPPNQASFMQRMGRAGRRDGNSFATTFADGVSPHDLYFFEDTQEMMAGDVNPPGVFLQAADVLRRQLLAFCLDDWIAQQSSLTALPEKTSAVLDAVHNAANDRFPYSFCNYVLSNEALLLNRFIALLGTDASPSVIQRLTDYIEGQNEQNGLRIGLLKVFEELEKERKTLKQTKDKLDRQKNGLKNTPNDPSKEEELDEIAKATNKVLMAIAEINNRELLNTMTDAGLIPNYAFPEAGVELKSLLWRKRRTNEPGDGKYIALQPICYERPANSALSEFAPENKFYANQRRVEINQINMSLASTEEWRFCPACHHMEHILITSADKPACPRCGDEMWADQSQKRTLLRFKQAIANSDDTKNRIDDSAEDREPKIYVRQLLVDFEKQNIKQAWQIKAGGVPFGFEFISRVDFRDINFGELGKNGESFKVADKDQSRPGFKLCKTCGTIQNQKNKRKDNESQDHAFECTVSDKNNPSNIIDCLYLYREFSSEALRILIPFTKTGVDARSQQSFMAALQLGLKIRFGGKVDHLRLLVQEEPGKDGQDKRHYVVLYDSVPGGTGYLEQLLTQEANTLSDVLKMALSAMENCVCQQDPEKDGCYKCVYQYRLGRQMHLVSRDTGVSILKELVDSLDQLEKITTISDIFINASFDSVLESRFIESLKRSAITQKLKNIRLVQDIVNGKSGFVFEVNGQRYKIEPQKNLGPSEGVLVTSVPDFIIYPWQSNSQRKPIAVFCDGWTYHKDSIAADALKRSAIVCSGQYWVWSVTYEDVQQCLDGITHTDLPTLTTFYQRHDGNKAPPTFNRMKEGAFQNHAIDVLVKWLSSPIPQAGMLDQFVQNMQTNAMWLSFLMMPLNPEILNKSTQEFLALGLQLPDWKNASKKSFLCSSPLSKQPFVANHFQVEFLGKNSHELLHSEYLPGVVAIEDKQDLPEKDLKLAWRIWLHTFNYLQVLPGMLMASTSLGESGKLTGLTPPPFKYLKNKSSTNTDANANANVSAKPPVVAASPMDSELENKPVISASTATTSVINSMNVEQETSAANKALWLEAIEYGDELLKDNLQILANKNISAPVVAKELLNDKMAIIADCELAWVNEKIVILRADQAETKELWQQAAWQTYVLDANCEYFVSVPETLENHISTKQSVSWLDVLLKAFPS